MQSTITLRDVRGNAHSPLSPAPVRLVSLVPSTTETLFAVGRGDDVVGYTRFCVHPRDRLTPDKWIGGTKNPKLDKIVALHPDLVFANREENRIEDITVLEAAGVRVWVAEPRTVIEAIEDIRNTATLVGCSDVGHRLATALDTTLADVHRHCVAPPRTVAYLIWRDPYMVAGTETFIADMMAQTGLHTPFRGRYPEVSMDDLKQVDRVWLASEPFPFKEPDRDALVAAGIPADRLCLVDGELISWHGVRLAEGLPYVKHLAHDGKA